MFSWRNNENINKKKCLNWNWFTTQYENLFIMPTTLKKLSGGLIAFALFVSLYIGYSVRHPLHLRKYLNLGSDLLGLRSRSSD